MIEKYRFAFLLKKLFPIFQSLGFHVTRNHFYEPIPDTRKLKDDIWEQKSNLVGVDLNEAYQLDLMQKLYLLFYDEYNNLPLKKNEIINSYDYYLSNPYFHSADGQVLYALIRFLKPRRIIEVGSGFSTYLIAKTVQKNYQETEYECQFITIDPFPNKTIRKGFPGLTKVIIQKVQDVSFYEFQKLEDNDLLFIDSSHILKIGSDVQYEFLEIFPRLSKGVIIHIHDIFLPCEYPKEWIMRDYRFWNEQYLLQAFLEFNACFDVIFSCYYLYETHTDDYLHAFMPMISKNSKPSSFYIRKMR